MSERVIARITAWPTSENDTVQEPECCPDPDAPRVSEILEVLKVSRSHVEQARKCFKEHEAHAANAWASRGMLQNIDYLISRLEGE